MKQNDIKNNIDKDIRYNEKFQEVSIQATQDYSLIPSNIKYNIVLTLQP